jgi:UDPglucose--hexose-1-phosphate uridylyltransferase
LLRIEGDIERRPAGMFDFMNAIGAHELVADAAEHESTWADFSPAHMARLLAVYRDRSRDLRRDGRFRYVLVLMNRGASWSRYTHPHSHIVAAPFTPKRIEEELAGARAYYRQKERCAFCDQVAEERHAGIRIVSEQPGFVALTPFASEHAYETWIVPSRHEADFGQLPDDGLRPLATLLVDTLGRLRRALDDPAYSIALHAGDVDGSDATEYHWHWEIVPLLGHEFGMEWATGIISNPVPPEAAAGMLRRAGET